MDLLGVQQTLIYDEGNPNEITLLLEDADENYLSTGRDTYLDAYGYDRIADPEFAADIITSAEGSAFWFGRNLEPQLAQWNLNLPLDKVYTLQGIVKRQQDEKLPVLLLDQRLPIIQSTPRTRGKVGTLTGAPSVPGTEFFWPTLYLKLELALGEIFDCDRQFVTLSGKEILPFPTTDR